MTTLSKMADNLRILPRFLGQISSLHRRIYYSGAPVNAESASTFSQMQKTGLKCPPTRGIQTLVRQCRPTHISKFAHWGAKFWKGAPQGKAEGNDAARPAERLTVEAAFFMSSRDVPDRLSPKFRKGQNKCWINVVS
jgi:hypothetical protein